MTDLLTALTRTLHATPTIAVLGALLWGVASVLLSPCHLAGVPLVVAYTGRSASVSSRRAAGLSAVLALGILVTIACVGALSVMAGRIVGGFGRVAEYAVAALLFVVGLELLGVWPFRWVGLPRATSARRGWLGAFLFGLAFGTALGPCTFAFLAPVVGLSVELAGRRPGLAMLVMLAYAAGHCLVLALAGASGPWLSAVIAWSGRGGLVLRRACGVLVLAGGLYLVYVAP